MKEIELMIKEDIERELKQFEGTIKEGQEIREKLTKENLMARYYDKQEWIEFANKPTFIYWKLKTNYGEVGAREKVKKSVIDHYKNLQSKVEKKIGKILEITPTGNNGYDYFMKGENGNCEVEVILAGGYNIQRLHTRWIIK